MYYYVSDLPVRGVQSATIDDAIDFISSCDWVAFDTETTGLDPHQHELLSIQLGNPSIQFVIDAKVKQFQDLLDYLPKVKLIAHNAKFDLGFLLKYNCTPLHIFDTMLAEQVIHLGKQHIIQCSLKAVASRYLGVDMDKEIRSQISVLGMTKEVIEYSALDVAYLHPIMEKQITIAKKNHITKAIKLENQAVPSLAYIEWCGLKLDPDKWMAKCKEEEGRLKEAFDKLESLAPPRNGCMIPNWNWASPKDSAEVFQLLGFDTKSINGDSVQAKQISNQRYINPDFYDAYMNWKEWATRVNGYGPKYLRAINPTTGRVHPTLSQLGATTGRIYGKKDTHGNPVKLQQMPADVITRSCFVAEEGNLLIDADYSALESYLGAELYNDQAFKEEFLYGSGDSHALFAWIVFNDECRNLGCESVKDVKEKAPEWRKKVKAIEFAWMFGGGAGTIASTANCSKQEAQGYIDRMNKGFAGVSEFAVKGAEFAWKNGYVVINGVTGHRINWPYFEKWKLYEDSITDDFKKQINEIYSAIHTDGTLYGRPLTKQEIQAYESYSNHQKEKFFWSRVARNAVTQGTGACVIKTALTLLYNQIIENNWLNKVKICMTIHDELLIETPKDMVDVVSSVLTKSMGDAADIFCKFKHIPASADISEHWVH